MIWNKDMLNRCLRLGALLLAVVAMPAVAQPVKVGYVNAFRIENESPLAKRLVEDMKKEFEPREREIAQLQQQGAALGAELRENAAKMPESERQTKERRFTELAKQFDQARRSFAEDLELRRGEGRAQLVQQVSAIIRRIAESEHFDLILQQAVYGSPQIDITERVLAEMAKGNAASGKK
jgi:outer membrane protein